MNDKEFEKRYVKIYNLIVDILSKSKISPMMICGMLDQMKMDIYFNKVIKLDGEVKAKEKEQNNGE